jgi:bifunctional isochorismate lyase/aryl carrier protein
MQKEQYFTPDNIEERARVLLASVEPLRQRHASITFQPERAALLVLDMQQYFLQGSSHAFVPSAPAIIPGINRLITTFESVQQPVIATRHLNTIENAGMMSIWWRDLINPRIAYSHYIKSLKLENTLKIKKAQYDAFHQTNLEETLHRLDIKQVVITGVMTHLCCESTARSAFIRGFEVFFTVDGTATYNEELHRASLLTLSHGFAIPVLIGELLAAMDANAV